MTVCQHQGLANRVRTLPQKRLPIVNPEMASEVHVKSVRKHALYKDPANKINMFFFLTYV